MSNKKDMLYEIKEIENKLNKLFKIKDAHKGNDNCKDKDRGFLHKFFFRKRVYITCFLFLLKLYIFYGMSWLVVFLPVYLPWVFRLVCISSLVLSSRARREIIILIEYMTYDVKNDMFIFSDYKRYREKRRK